jgi:hypothetical protein
MARLSFDRLFRVTINALCSGEITMGKPPPTRNANIAVFASDDGHIHTVSDVVVAAHFRGELNEPWRRMLQRLAADEMAAERDLEVGSDALQALSDEFRSDRDLITAEETERWLELRGLSLDDFNDYFVRIYWGDVLAAKAAPEEIEYVVAPEELRERMTVELLLSGDIDRMATELSWQVASRRAMPERGVDRDVLAGERALFLERTQIDDEGVAAWLDGLGRDQAWLDEMLALAATYRRARAMLVTDEMCRAELAAVRLPLTKIDVETIELESRNAAKEALMCVRNDGISLAEVAAESSYPHQRGTILLEDLPDDLHERVLCAAPGELLEPVPHGDGFQVCQIHQKTDPTLADPEVRVRIEERILEQAFAELCAQHVHWRMPLTSIP